MTELTHHAGAPWLKGIPTGWTTRRGKFLLLERAELSVDGSETLLSISEYYGVQPRSDRHGDAAFLSRAESLIGYKKVYAHDLAMNIMLAWKGAQGVSDIDGIVSPAYAVFEIDREQLIPAFAHHLFRSDPYIAEFKRRSTGIIDSRLRLYPASFLDIHVVLPPIPLQRAIASFLDIETSRIDQLLVAKERLLVALDELRTSVISEVLIGSKTETTETSNKWIPKIPGGWELKRLKHLGLIRSGIAKGKKIGGEEVVEVPYMRVANVQDGRIELSDVANLEVAISDVERYALKKHDVLMNEGGDYDKVGRGAVWKGEIEPCLHQNHVFAVRMDDPGVADWVSAITRTAYAKFYFMNNAKQSTNLASIGQKNIKEFPVVMPPKEDRVRRLAHLNHELAKIADLEAHVRTEIEALAELRSATITDAVMGRIDLTDFRLATHVEEAA